MAHLYKYVTADTGKKMLRFGSLRWSTPPILNDPFDMQFAFQLRYDPQVIRTMAAEKHWHLYSSEVVERPLHVSGQLLRYLRNNGPLMARREFDNAFHGVIDECIQQTEARIQKHSRELIDLFSNDKILCLSEINDSILMWSYYAGNHSGLVFRFTDDVPLGATKMAKPVRYVEHFPSLVSDEVFSDMLAGYDALDRRKILDDIVFTKSHHWSHEREWRIYAGSGRSKAASEDIPFIPEELNGVIFGLRASGETRTEILNLLKGRYPHVETMQAKVKENSYALTIAATGA